MGEHKKFAPAQFACGSGCDSNAYQDVCPNKKKQKT